MPTSEHFGRQTRLQVMKGETYTETQPHQGSLGDGAKDVLGSLPCPKEELSVARDLILQFIRPNIEALDIRTVG